MVMSRGQDERSQMHAIILLLNTCSGKTNRVHIDEGARWILQRDEQERDSRTAGVKALYSMLTATTSGRAKELVKQGFSERNGMIAFGRIRERFGKTAGVAKLSDVFQFQWTSPDSLEDKWLRWQKLLRQVNMTSSGDDARETLTNAGLEKAKERSLEQQFRLSAPQTWAVLCASVDQNLRTTVDSNSQPTPVEIGAVMATCASCGKAGHEKVRCRFRNLVQQLWQDWTSHSDVQTTSEICWQVKSLEQQQEFWQRRHEPWKHRQVLLWWTGRSSTT